MSLSDLESRRLFLRSAVAASASWVVADLLQVEEALAWAGRQAGASPGDALKVLTPRQVEALDALTARLLPSVDGRPGAREAGVVYFIDRSLATFNAAQKTVYTNGVRDVNQRAGRVRNGSITFAALTAEQQDDVIRGIEKTPFFEAVRFDTIVGTFALPSWGGNRDYVGWQLLGLDHQMQYQPPFGFYDADVNRRS